MGLEILKNCIDKCRGTQILVTFEMVEQKDNLYTYWYYPENKRALRPGIIVVDTIREYIEITRVAEGDWERDIPAAEINQLVDAINQMEAESGGTDFSEYVTEDEHSIYYGDHAVNEIIKYLRKGEIPEKGIRMWY